MKNSQAKNILIIEDSPDLQELLSELFRSDGYIPAQAYNGKQALNMLTSTFPIPGVILLDMMMPVMDGFEFLEKKQKIPELQQIPVIVMSADANIEKKLSSLDVKAFVAKPMKVDDLIQLANQTILA